VIRRRITVLGATGSVGASTLDLMAQAEATGTGAFEVEALTGGANIAKLAEQAKRWRPKLAVTADPARLDELRDALSGTDVASPPATPPSLRRRRDLPTGSWRPSSERRV
jgi:1-deoxy-D-xylulose-5-phosphate reductoisomerase